MRRRRTRRESFSISLFPFLAVLICTFGVLIILLVIVVKAADQRATDKQLAERDQQQMKVTEMQDRLDLHGIQIDGLSSLRPELLKQLQSERSRRAHLQSELDKLAVEAELLNAEMEFVTKVSGQQPIQQPDADIERLQEQLTTAQAELQQQKQSANTSPRVKYSVVPHTGPNGTRRRPIYIECLRDRFVIQPYGISLNRDDFVDPIVANNPLDAALVAIREYFIKNGLSQTGETPYPLLIVRPDGPSSYVIARRAISSWDEEFGYELISADKALDFGENDPQLQRKLEQVIAAAKQRQKQYVAASLLNRSPRETTVQDVGGLKASSQFGGFVSQAGTKLPPPNGNNASAERTKTAADESLNTEQGTGDQQSDAKRDADIELNGIQAEGASIAEQRGEGWALPSKSEGAIAYRRPLKLLVSDQELTIDADSRSNKRIRIEFGNDPNKATLDLVEAIWHRIETWGVAGVGGYWKPELDVVVSPGGEHRYQQLLNLLNQSGIELKEPQP